MSVMAPPTAADVAEAARALEGRIVRTPLVVSPALSRRHGAEVLVKAELLQRGGSFKLRGVLNRARQLGSEHRERGVATISAGNHALAVALVCQSEGVRATVFMPRNADPLKVAATRAAGAQVDVDNASAAEGFARLAEFADRTGAYVLHPFDDPAVIAGQGTVGAEILADRPDAATIVAPVGGGGMLSGIALVAKAANPEIRLIAVEPEVAATLTAALAAGEPVEVEHRPTIADALAPPSVGRLNHAILSEHVDEVITLSEDELRDGLRAAYADAKLACEAGGAAAIAALVAGRLAAGSPLVLVATGGNIHPAVLARLIA